MNYYSIYKGTKTGIFTTWDECKKYTKGFKGAIFKKFNNLNDAKLFLKNGNKPKYILKQTKITDYFNTTSISLLENNSSQKSFSIFKNNNIKIINVYTDGSCINNGKKYAKAGYGIYIPIKNIQISKRIIGKQTNNTAEITAIIKIFDILNQDIKNKNNIKIYTDSKYSILAATSYGKKLEKQNWKTKKPIPNFKLVKQLYTIYKKFNNVKLIYVKAHTGNLKDEHSYGNNKADYLAKKSLKLN